MRWYLPSTSFIGYFRRYSPWPCSRTAAPLAQCAPRLIGRIEHRLLAHPDAVLDDRVDRAAHRAVAAHGALDFDLGVRRTRVWRIGRLALRTSSKLRRRHAGADAEAGAAQEGTAIERRDRARDAARQAVMTRLDDDAVGCSDLRVSSMAEPLTGTGWRGRAIAGRVAAVFRPWWSGSSAARVGEPVAAALFRLVLRLAPDAGVSRALARGQQRGRAAASAPVVPAPPNNSRATAASGMFGSSGLTAGFMVTSLDVGARNLCTRVQITPD